MKCAYEGCELSATTLAKGRATQAYGVDAVEHGHPNVAMYCEAHAEVVADERAPEYTVSCPHCGCRFGVN